MQIKFRSLREFEHWKRQQIEANVAQAKRELTEQGCPASRLPLELDALRQALTDDLEATMDHCRQVVADQMVADQIAADPQGRGIGPSRH